METTKQIYEAVDGRVADRRAKLAALWNAHKDALLLGVSEEMRGMGENAHVAAFVAAYDMKAVHFKLVGFSVDVLSRVFAQNLQRVLDVKLLSWTRE